MLLGINLLAKTLVEGGEVQAQIQYQTSDLTIIGGNSLKSSYPTFFPKTQVLGSLFGSGDSLYWHTWSVYPEFFRIIECESQWTSDVCNKKYGCKAGMGLGQLISSTVGYCEEKLGRYIDPLNAQDNYDCSLWLYLNEGTRHWGTAETEWGSYACWHI